VPRGLVRRGYERRRSGGQVEACLPFSEYRIGAITAEHNYEEPKRTRIRQLLEANGYRLDRAQLVEGWYVLVSPE
jgi:hypothetical protein